MRGFLKIASTENRTKLQTALDDAQFFPTDAAKKQRGKTLTDAEYRTLQQKSGQKFAGYLQKALDDPKYRNAEQDRQQSILQAALSDARSASLDEMFGKQAKKKSTKVQHYN